MARDPLSVFLSEKTAAAPASTLLSDIHAAPEKPVTKDPDPTSLDPGERAIAGVAAVSGSLAAKVVPFIGTRVLAAMGTSGDVPWKGMPDIMGAKSFADARLEAPFGRRGKVLGLFNVTGRERQIGGPGHKATQRRFLELEKTVDAFINKNKLTEKGVRLNFPTGTAGALGGPRYVPATKEVHLPDLSKSTVLHELGHAADRTTGRMGRMRSIAEPMLRRGVLTALPVALIAGDRIKEMLPGTIDDKAISFMQDNAPEILAATLAATQLYPEAKASIMATQHVARTEGRKAAIGVAKRLAPVWGTYLLGAIPAVVGMAVARKYMRDARNEKQSILDEALANRDGLDKEGGAKGMLGGIADLLVEGAQDVGHVAKQINRQSVDLLRQPGTMRKIVRASKEVGASPEFVQGAIVSAVPATMAALYLYGTNSGAMIRARTEHPNVEEMVTAKRKGLPLVRNVNEEWREQHPGRFAAIVGASAALSGGIMAKFLTDLGRVI